MSNNICYIIKNKPTHFYILYTIEREREEVKEKINKMEMNC